MTVPHNTQRRSILPLLIGLLLIVGVVLSGCGGGKISSDEVPGGAPEVNVIKGNATGGLSAGQDKKSSTDMQHDSFEQSQSGQSGIGTAGATNGGAAATTAKPNSTNQSTSNTTGTATGGAGPSKTTNTAPSQQNQVLPSRPVTRSNTGGASAQPDSQQQGRSAGTGAGASAPQKAKDRTFDQFCRDNPGAC